MDKMSGIVLKAANKAGIPTRISHSHSTQSEGNIVARLYKWYAGKLILPNATNLIACSNEAAKWLFPKNAENHYFKNGIECEQFSFSHEIRKQVREELNFRRRYICFRSCRRFSYAKNHTFLIEIFAEFIK